MIPRHLALYYTPHTPPWASCQRFIAQYRKRRWAVVYVHDEHSSQGVTDQLSSVTGVASHELGFHASPVRVPEIIASLRERIAQALEQHKGVLFLIEMTWAIRSPSGAVYLREYEAAIHDLTQELPVAFACLFNQQLMLSSQLLSSLHTHPNLIAADGLHQNPHFVPPRIHARQDERAQFRYWLEGISPSFTQEIPASQQPSSVPPAYNLENPDLLIAEGTDGQWKIRCFGSLRIYRSDGSSIEWRTPQGATKKVKTLFAYLLFRGEQGADADELVDLLWPKAKDLKQGLNRLHHTVNCLRSVLHQGNQVSFVRQESHRYALAVPEHTWLDYPMFQQLCYQGNALLHDGDLEAAIVAYQGAERLYTGDFLSDIPLEYAANEEFDWCYGRRFWYREMYLKMLSGLSMLHRQSQQLPQALHYADKALKLEPCSEVATSEKLLALHAANRQDALERQYRQYLRSLERFGMGEASSAVTGLYESLRH